MDTTTTVANLKTLVDRFVRQRDWQQFHTPKNLSMGLAIEAAELMELFQWYSGPESIRVAQQRRVKRAAGRRARRLRHLLFVLRHFHRHRCRRRGAAQTGEEQT